MTGMNIFHACRTILLKNNRLLWGNCMEEKQDLKPVKIRELLQAGKRRLSEHEILDSEYDAKALLIYLLNCDMTGLFLRMEDEADGRLIQDYEALIDKRNSHYPLQYITGTQNFMGYDFHVNVGVLIPRQDTEILVEEALLTAGSMGNKPLRVLDLCTGSGCIGISYYLKRREAGLRDTVVLSDISAKALRIAKENAVSLSGTYDTDMEQDILFLESDLWNRLEEEKAEGFSLILSNPPYIRTGEIPELMPEVKDYEPITALDGEADGLSFYRRIAKDAPDFLKNGGYLILEIGYDQYEDVCGFLQNGGFSEIELRKDYAGLDRVIKARYCK